ncbi:MAG: hypothetical protein Q7S33_01105 [Nanoarchaeota archaeon]|nr:hypothetical protein [Nanoarchaeota archaeon]
MICPNKKCQKPMKVEGSNQRYICVSCNKVINWSSKEPDKPAK